MQCHQWQDLLSELLIAIAPEQPITIAYIIAEQIWKKSQSFAKAKDLEFPPCSNYFFVKLSQF